MTNSKNVVLATARNPGKTFREIVIKRCSNLSIYSIGYYSNNWLLSKFKLCKETPELLRALGLMRLKYNKHQIIYKKG